MSVLYMFLTFACVYVTVTHAVTPLKIIDDSEDDDGEMIRNMFKGIRSMITGFTPLQPRLIQRNQSKDSDIESAASFVYPDHAKMRDLISKKMAGAENVTAASDMGFVKMTDSKMADGLGKMVVGEPMVVAKWRSGSGLDKREDKHIELEGGDFVKGVEIGCSEGSDCNKTSYCNKLSYTCESCHQHGGGCSTKDECCGDSVCDMDSNTCKKKRGNVGESCSSKSDCGGEYCCALNDDGEGTCQPYLKEGEDCGRDPFTAFFASQSLFLRDSVAGLPNKCPCHQELKCERKRSLIFMESEVCVKQKEKKQPDNHKAFIKITFKTSPIMKFHSLGSSDMEDMPSLPSLPSLLPSLFPKAMLFPKDNTHSLTKSIFHKLVPRSPHFTMRFSKLLHNNDKNNNNDNNKMKNPLHGISLRKSAFPFSSFLHFRNPFDDDEAGVDQIKEKLKKRREMKQRAKRSMVNGVGEEARVNVHRAVDSIFDTIMKKLAAQKRE